MKIMLSIIFVTGLALTFWGCVAYVEPDGYYGDRHYYESPRYRYYYYDYGYPYGRGQYYRFRGRKH